MANEESSSAKKEPPWSSILPPMPRISVSTTSRARLSHRRPVLHSLTTPPCLAPAPGAVLDRSPPSLVSPKSSLKCSESPISETLQDHDPFHFPPPPPAAVALAVVAASPPSSFCPKFNRKSDGSPILATLPAHDRDSAPSPFPSALHVTDFAAAPPSSFTAKFTCEHSETPILEALPAPTSSPQSSASLSRSWAAARGEGSWPACSSSSAGLDTGADDAARAVTVSSLGSRDSSRNLSSVRAVSEVVTSSSSEECISAHNCHSLVSHPTAGIPSPAAVKQPSTFEDGRPGVQTNGVGFGTDSAYGASEAKDPETGGLSRDGGASDDMEFTDAETTSLAGRLDDGCGGPGNRSSEENGLDACPEVEASGLVFSGKVFDDEDKLEDGQQPRNDGHTVSDIEITTAEFSSASGLHNALGEVDGSKAVDSGVNYENILEIGREAEISDLANQEELVVDEGDLEEGQLPGEWSGGEESHEDSEPAQSSEVSAALSPVLREVPTISMALNVANKIYYPFQVEGNIHPEQRSGGNIVAKGKKKKKHKKGEGSKKRSREKSKEKHMEVLNKRKGKGKEFDRGSNSDALRNNKDNSGRGDQTQKHTATGKLNKVTENVSQTLPKKPTVDEGPEDGEILLEPPKTNGILSSLIEGEVGLWTTDDVDDQLVAEMEQDGALKRKRGPETAERKLKRKIAKRKKRAQKERELGIRRPPRTIESKPVKVLCTHYMKGRCAKGDQCTFSHDAVPLTKQEPCKFLMSNSCLKGDDCPYSHDLRAFPCKFFHTRGLCYDGENCQFSHGAISEEALAKLKQRVEKEKKERISSTSALDIPTPSFSTPLPPELDPDPLGWGTSSLHSSLEEQMQYGSTAMLDQSTRLFGDVNTENYAAVPQANGRMPGPSSGLSTATDRKVDSGVNAVTSLRLGEEADEYKFMQLTHAKALQPEKSSDLRQLRSEGNLYSPMGPASSEEGAYSPTTEPKISPNQSCNGRDVLEVRRMEEKMGPAQGPGDDLTPNSNLSGPPQDALSPPPLSLLSSLLARSAVPMLRGRQLGSLGFGLQQRVVQSSEQTKLKRQHTVDSLLDEALRR